MAFDAQAALPASVRVTTCRGVLRFLPERSEETTNNHTAQKSSCLFALALTPKGTASERLGF